MIESVVNMENDNEYIPPKCIICKQGFHQDDKLIVTLKGRIISVIKSINHQEDAYEIEYYFKGCAYAHEACVVATQGMEDCGCAKLSGI